MDIEKDSNREAFEVWFESQLESTKLHKINGVYLHERAQMAWKAWQAAKAQAVPEGFMVVPKVATKQMVNAGYEAHDGFFTNGAVQDVYVAMIEAAKEPAND